MNTKINQLSVIVISLASIALVVSGCLKKPVTPPVNQNQNSNTATTTIEIDTSDWKTYRNEEYGFEFKYPANLVKQDNIFYSSDYSENRDNTNFIKKGFKVTVSFEKLASTQDWDTWVKRPGGSIGQPTYTAMITNDGHNYIKKVSIGNGFADQWPLDLRFTEVNFLSSKQRANIVITFSSQNNDKEAVLISKQIISTLNLE